MKLQKQLTLSHLAVTTVSLTVLVIGGLLGYAVYLRSDYAAQWAAEVATYYAEQIAFDMADGCDTHCIQEIITENLLVPTDEDPEYDEWLVVVNNDRTVFATNYPDKYPLQTTITPSQLFGVETSEFVALYGNQDDRHYAVAPIPDNQGWVYYHGGNNYSDFLLSDTTRTALKVGGVLILIAVLISGIMGSRLSRRFGKKLATLGSASAAFAAGNLETRIPHTGQDEIGTLGQQFNQMADTIAQQMKELQELAERNAQLAEQAEELARMEERNRIARELHDAVKQQLFGLNLALGSIPALIDTKPDVARQRLQNVSSQTQTIHIELDQIIQQLRPASLQNQGLAPAVRQLATQWSNQTGVEISVSIQHHHPLPLAIEQATYRIIQEALHNISKHAQAQQVQIILKYEQAQLLMQVLDDGQGFDLTQVNPTLSFGLQNMRQRAADVGGTCEISSSAAGTHITVHIPLPDNHAVQTDG